MLSSSILSASAPIGHLNPMSISVSFAHAFSLSDSIIVGLLLILIIAGLCALFPTKWSEPLTLFTAVLALATIVLAGVSFLQWKTFNRQAITLDKQAVTLDQQASTLEKTDATMRAGERAFVFVTHKGAGWQRPYMVDGQITRNYPIVWENSGNSPTKNLQLELYCLPITPYTTANPMMNRIKLKRVLN